MPERATDVQPRKRLADCRSASLASGVAVSLLGLSVLAGYALRVQALKSVVPGLVSMNPATAVSLVLLGLSVALRYFHAGRRSWLSRVGQAAGGLSALAGLAKLLSIAIGHDSVFDRTLFASQMADPAGYASRMSPNTALALLLAGYAAVLLYRERGARGAQRLAVAAMFVAILAVLGYAYGVDAFIGVTGFIPMALNTAVGVLAASSGILLAAPAEGMMGVINGETAGGSMARRLLPAALFVPSLIGFVLIQGPAAMLLDGALRHSLSVTANVAFFAALILLVARDLAALDADRDAAVDRLRAEKVRQEAFLASIGDGVFAIDRAWNVTLWNRSAEHITGWSSAETVGRPLRDAMTFVREKDGTENVAFIEEVMLRGETRTMENGSLLVTKDGRRVPVADSAAPVFRGATGAVDGAIVVFRDVSAEHTLKDREREIARLKDEFLFRTVHDLQSPVTGIRLALGLHAEQEAAAGAAPALRQGIAAIQDACGRMASLIDDLLKVARGEESSLALRREPVDVDAMVDAVLAQARPQMEARRVTASRSGGPLRAMADADGLKEVLENLVSNAVKYNRDGGEVTVTLSDAEGQARVTVHDTGIGIGPDDLRRLFRPYFRAGGGDVKGTGLGLYIVKKLLDKMGGSVAAESVPGKGTAFTVSLPKA